MQSTAVDIPGPARLGLISDTHILPGGSREIFPAVLDALARMKPDVIVHAGDVATREVLDSLGEIAPVLAVRGNNDVGEFGRSLPTVLTITCLGKTIRVVHGDGGRSAKAVAEEYAATSDCVIYGHSHIPDVRRVDRALMVNPGSANDRRWHPHFGIGYLDISAAGLDPRLLLFVDALELDSMTIPPLIRT